MTRCYIDNADYRNADLYVREWLSLDCMNEAAYRYLMPITTWSGNRSAAVRHYEDAVSVLSDELGVEPQESTRKLYEAIMDDRIEVSGPRTVSEVQDQSSPKKAARDAESGTVQPFEKEPSVDKRYAKIVVMRLRHIGNRDEANMP